MNRKDPKQSESVQNMAPSPDLVHAQRGTKGETDRLISRVQDETIKKMEIHLQGLLILRQIEEAKKIMSGFDEAFESMIAGNKVRELMILLRKVDKYLRTIDVNAFQKERRIWAYRAKQILALYQTYKPKAPPRPVKNATEALQVFDLTWETLSRPTLKKKYRELVKKYHPDLHADEPDADALMIRLNTARDFLEKFMEGK